MAEHNQRYFICNALHCNPNFHMITTVSYCNKKRMQSSILNRTGNMHQILPKSLIMTHCSLKHLSKLHFTLRKLDTVKI